MERESACLAFIKEPGEMLVLVGYLTTVCASASEAFPEKGGRTEWDCAAPASGGGGQACSTAFRRNQSLSLMGTWWKDGNAKEVGREGGSCTGDMLPADKSLSAGEESELKPNPAAEEEPGENGWNARGAKERTESSETRTKSCDDLVGGERGSGEKEEDRTAAPVLCEKAGGEGGWEVEERAGLEGEEGAEELMLGGSANGAAIF